MVDPVSVVVSPIVKVVIGYAASVVQQKYELLQGLEDDIKNLSSKLTAIQSVLEDAERKQLDNASMRDWLGKLKEVAYHAEDLLKLLAAEALLWKKKQHQVRKFPPPLIGATKLTVHKINGAEEIKGILARLDEIGKEKKQFHLNVHISEDNNQSAINLSNHTSYNVIESDIVGREEDKEKIVEMLLREEGELAGGAISVIPIIGMGGLGKTTLAQAAFNDPRVFVDGSTANPFDSRMWVCVTVNFDYRRILKEMIQFHTKYDINNLSDNQLESRLLEFLAGKRFLLVLDDVWIQGFNKWEKVQNLLKQGGRGSKVLITSRNIRVSEVMGTVPLYPLGTLPEEQCWSLFERIVFKEQRIEHNLHRELNGIGRKIVSKCNGLPLAVKAMAGVLRGDIRVDKWEQIERHEVWKVEELSTNAGDPIVLPALRLSYDDLSSPLKQCFAYCYVLPKGYVFDKIELVKLWKAESFIPPQELNTVDEIGRDYFDELFMRSFFQLYNIDEKQRFKMHDLIHELAHSISSPYCCQIKDDGLCHASEKSRHVSLLCQDVEGAAMNIIKSSERVRTLLLPREDHRDFGKALDLMFQSLKYLRLLDLSSSSLIELPSSIEGLKLLQYLNLSKNDIRELPESICSLHNLQTLKLLSCPWLSKLPKDLANLVNLEHLELDDIFWFKLSTLPPNIGNLTSLQNLNVFRVSHESGYGINELKGMNCLTGTLHISKLECAVAAAEANLKDKKELKELVFEWSQCHTVAASGSHDEAAEERVLEDLQPNSRLQVLQIFCYEGTNMPSWIRNGLLPNLVKLSLKQCSNCKILSLGTMQSLRELDVKGMLELEEWTDEFSPSLQRVNISNCPKLKKLPSFFIALRVLKIKRCASLKTLPFTRSVMFLILVDNLLLEDWNETKFFPTTPTADHGQHVGMMAYSFTRLLELKMIDCPKLQTLPRLLAPQKLEISGCRLLSTLPMPDRSRRLQHMALDGCDGEALIRAIPGTNSMYSLVISNISGLACLPKFPNLPGLKALYIRDCADLVSLSEDEPSFEGLPSLQFLSLWNNPQLVTLPPRGLPTSIEVLSIGACSNLQSLGAHETLKSLTSLQDLQLNDCPALESLPEEGLPASLQHLLIQGCPLLSKKCEADKGADWGKVKDVPDLEIEYVVEKPKTEAPSSKPWYHSFICCRGTATKELEELEQ